MLSVLVSNVDHPMLSVSVKDLSSPESIQFVIHEFVETLFWVYMASFNWWGLVKGFSILVVAWNFLVIQQWWKFLDSDGANGNFIELWEVNKWLHLPGYLSFDFFAWVALEVFDLEETNFYLSFIWLFPTF